MQRTDLLIRNLSETAEKARVWDRYYVTYWYYITRLDIGDLEEQRYQKRKSNISRRSWTMELKEELYNMELAHVLTKKQDCKLTEITKDCKR